jgi:GNAT superfamily N-acetyltransferase
MCPPPASEYDEEDDVPGDAPSPRPGPPPHLAELTLTTLTADRFEEFHRAAERGFQEEAPPEFLEAERAATEPERFFGFTVDGRWVSTFGSVRRMLTVPGGAAVPMSGVTAVTVHSAYRRRGLLRRAMAREFELARTRGETIAALYASESGIYGRFGYGVATAKYLLSGRTDALALRPDVAARLDAAGGSADEVPGDEFVGLVADLHERLRARRPGSLDRPRRLVGGAAQRPAGLAERGHRAALRHLLRRDRAHRRIRDLPGEGRRRRRREPGRTGADRRGRGGLPDRVRTAMAVSGEPRSGPDIHGAARGAGRAAALDGVRSTRRS